VKSELKKAEPETRFCACDDGLFSVLQFGYHETNIGCKAF
jgi:hypothetical protein